MNTTNVAYKTTHGMYGTRPYSIWASLKHRTIETKSRDAKYYHDKGITICKEWNTFIGFWNDMKSTYSDDLTIDRIDSSKGYYKSNCRWATMTVQNNNRSNTLIVTYKGVTDTLPNFCRELNLDYTKMLKRLHRKWTVERAFETKIRHYKVGD